MIKEYISILQLLPTLINDDEKAREDYQGFFPSKGRERTQYYYEVEESDLPSRKQLHFKDLKNMMVEVTKRIYERKGERYYDDVDEDNFKRKPYILNRQYQVPHILELEFLKLSPYGNILEEEHFNFVENIFYQYLLYYDRIVNFDSECFIDDMHHYRNTDENSDLYQNLRRFIIEKDNEDEDFNEFVQQTIMKNYEDLSKTKRPTKKVLRNMPKRMYACRNLDELLEIANKRDSRYNRDLEIITKAEGLSNSVPLLMLYSVIAQKTRNSLFPSYRNYQSIFTNYPNDVKGKMRESYILEEYIEDPNVSAYYYFDAERERKHFFYRYGGSVDRHNGYVDFHDNRMNMFLFPHIMNQIRIAYFQNDSKMVVPQSLMREFRSEPWKHLVKVETILSQRNLDWSESIC